VNLLTSSVALAGASEVILSVVTANQAANAAGQSAPHLHSRQP
jgi:hypothetical protein